MSWEPFVAALFAPVVVWVLWRCQILSVELLRWRLVKLIRNQNWLYATVSWLGVLLHELSHATVLLLSGHGIQGFNVHTEHGSVSPTKTRGGVGMLFFLVAALAPLFIPPALVLAGAVWRLDVSLPTPDAGSGLQPALDALRSVFVTFPLALAKAFGSMDLRDPWLIGLLVLALLASPSGRPSHVKGSRYHGTQDEGDIPALRKHIRKHPVPFIVFLLVLYGAYFLLVAGPFDGKASRFYWAAFGAIWAVALTGILLAFFGAAWWTITALNGRVSLWLAWLPLVVGIVALVLSYQADLATWQANLLGIGTWAILSAILAVAVPRQRRLPG